MTQISFFSINDYKERTSDLYPFALANECKEVADSILKSGSVVRDVLLIANPKFTVSNTISNTAIYFACIELFGTAPESINVDEDSKTFCLQ